MHIEFAFLSLSLRCTVSSVPFGSKAGWRWFAYISRASFLAAAMNAATFVKIVAGGGIQAPSIPCVEIAHYVHLAGR